MKVGFARAKINPTQELKIVAEWIAGQPVWATVEIPREIVAPGPRGYRVHVVDYDTSTKKFNPPVTLPVDSADIGDPALHAQNVYAIVMRTLSRFELALGRNVGWSFGGGHQIYVAPHAFSGANAFYSRRDHGLFFGYFKAQDGRDVYTCLSHDVVAHETSHALLDGLREGYLYASLPDQAAFHEALGDIVALLSMFSLPEVLKKALGALSDQTSARDNGYLLPRSSLTHDVLAQSALFGLAEGIGERGEALRRSVMIARDKESVEPHDRGELLVAAVMNAFLSIWLKRIARLGGGTTPEVDLETVAEQGALAAEHLLTMAIRAIDYSPCAGIEFSDYLSAFLTADYEVQTDDSKFEYRTTLREAFSSYGIKPVKTKGAEPNLWEPPSGPLDYRNTHFEAIRSNPDAVFHFIWQNRQTLDLCEKAYTQVRSVRPCVRVSWDGFVAHETISEYVEILTVTAGELQALGIKKPKEMPDDFSVTLFGGGVLVFDEYGAIKYHVKQKVLNAERQERFLSYMWKSGQYGQRGPGLRRFAQIHRARLMGGSVLQEDQDALF